MTTTDVLRTTWEPRDHIQSIIWDYLCAQALGPQNAVPATRIARELGIKDSAQSNLIRETVGAMISFGAPVVGGPRGFFIASNTAQLRAYEASLRSRQREIGRRRLALLQLVESLEGLEPDGENGEHRA